MVDRSETLLDFPDKATWPLSGHLIYLLIATLLLLGVGRPLLAKRGVSLKFLGALALLYGFFFGAIGCIMPLNWLFSDHLDLHHNANMLFFWPTDLAYILVGLRWLRSGKPIAVFGPRALRLLCHYQDLHVIMLVVGQILWASGVMRQDIGAVSVYVLAPTLLLWILTRRFGFTTNAGGFNGKKGAG